MLFVLSVHKCSCAQCGLATERGMWPCPATNPPQGGEPILHTVFGCAEQVLASGPAPTPPLCNQPPICMAFGRAQQGLVKGPGLRLVPLPNLLRDD